jgi:light-regulated signal transduction histidine kinase (bacteriophytochrome)
MQSHYTSATPPAYDLTNCADEPIRIPGQIQDHGYLLACDADELLVALSRNAGPLFADDAEFAASQRRLDDLPDTLVQSVKDCFNQLQEYADFPAYGGLFTPQDSGLSYEIVVTRNPQGLYIIELIPWESTEVENEEASCWYQHKIQRLMNRLSNASGVQEFTAELAENFRRVTEYDRVMIYRFDEDFNGQVIGESLRQGLEPFLGLHYPASDIPPQARALYLTNITRLLGDVNAEPVDILLDKEKVEHLDLSNAWLRSVSRLHIEYLRNMGVGATLTVSIVIEGRLWGLIACHHYSSKYVHYSFLQTVAFLSRVISGELNRILQIEIARESNKIQQIQDQLVQDMNETPRFMDALVAGTTNITHLLNADSAMVFFSSDVFSVGTTPDNKQVIALLDWVRQQMPETETLYTNTHLSADYPPAADFQKIASGVIVLFLSYDRMDAVVWFRKEILQKVSWAGNPDKAMVLNSDGQISRLQPRQSFEEWKEIKSGTSIPWSQAELNTAAHFRNPIVEMTLKQGVLLEKLNQELLQAKNEAVLANERKTEAISNMSHEVRTPLNSIIGYTELLKYGKAGELTEEQQRYINYAADNARHLLSIINDILDIAKIEAGNFSLYKTELLPKVILEESIQLTTPLTTQMSVKIETEYTPQVNDPINADPKRVKQILVNLLSNAVKYNRPEGVVTMRYYHESHQGQPHAVFDVSDTGIGMSQEQMGKLFSRFYRLENGAARKVDGTGLGLSITKQLVELHGGFLQVFSRPDEGSQFKVYLPIKQ